MGTDRDPGDQKPATPAPHHNPKMQVAQVLLPDGVKKEFEVNKNSEGEALFHQVTRDLSIEEREYFSLCFYDKEEGTRHWLYNDKQIAKQIKGLPWEFSFEVKFYPTTPTTIVDDHARYYLFLQLRRDLLTGRLPATPETHALLGSFVAQIEFGDAPAHIADEYEKYIVGAKLVPSANATPETFAKIAELHRELRGQTTGEAECLFLDHCKHLALYGIHIFKATDKDKKPVDIGVGAAGINVYQDEQKVHSFIWQNIIKIGYKRTYFSVKLKAGTIGKDEKTLYYKMPTHVASKRAWKCAVEHHTFFRLIQPEDRPHKSFFNFGSQRFRYQGRTQFQTKIASQMFDKPSTVDRAPSAMSQPIASAEDQKLQTLNLTDSELEQRQFERYRRALTPKSYTSSRQDDDAISNATFAKYSRPSTMLVVSTSGHHQQQQQDLSYSPRDDSSQYSSAAYYMSERSSLRTPSSAYYPPSEYTSPTSPVYYEGQHHGEYHVQMRQTDSSGRSGARRNLFGRSSDARSSATNSVRLVSFHEPVDPNEPIPNTYPTNELPQIPIERIVHVYHEGHYDRLSPRHQQQRVELPYGFGNYTPRNGVSHVDNLQPDGEMDQQPIRFYVDVRHSGASRRDPAKRLSHPGKEDVKEKIDLKDYEFSAASTSDPLHRTELSREVQPVNIQQFTRRYHSGDSTQKTEPPKYRLITHVHPLVVSNDGKNGGGQSSSNVTATISQREQVVSTKVRRESPDADRRVRLSASVDRSGNLTDTTEEMTRSSATTTTVTTTTTVITSDLVQSSEEHRKKKDKKKKTPKIPPSSSPVPSPSSQESRSRFGGFFTTKKSKGYPESSHAFSGDLDTTKRAGELEPSDYEHPHPVPAYSPKPTTAESTSQEHPSKTKKRHSHVETPEVPKKYRLIARTRHEGDEDVVEKPETYGFSSGAHTGPVEEIGRRRELEQAPLGAQPRTWAYEKIEDTVVPVGKQQKSSKKVPAEEPEKKEIRLIAKVRSEPEEPDSSRHSETPKSRFGFFSRTTKSSRPGYSTTSEAYSGDLDTTTRVQDLDRSSFDHPEYPAYVPKPKEEEPFEHTQTPTTSPIEKKTKKTKKIVAVPSEETEKKEVRLIARVINEQEPEATESSEVTQKPKKESSSRFGFFSRTTKTTRTGYPESSDAFTGDLDTTKRSDDLEHSGFEHGDYPAYKPKPEEAYEPSVRSDSDVVEAPAAYGFPSTSYDGPLETTALERDLEHSRISGVYHDGFYTKLSAKKSPVLAVRKQKKVKKEEEPPREVKLVARYLPTEPEESQKSKSKKTSKTTQAADSSESSPTRIISETDPVVSHEKKRYRLLARFRHEGEEDVVEKPEAYGFDSEIYQGTLDDIRPSGEIDHAPLEDYSKAPWVAPVPVVEKKEKKVKVAKKSVPEEPEKKEIRLISKIKTEPEEEQVVDSFKEKKPKKESSSKFGFFTKSAKKTPAGYPTTSDAYAGDLDTMKRSHDLETSTFEHAEYPEYIPKNIIVEAVRVPKKTEKKRYRLITRLRHEGEEDVVENPNSYGFSTDAHVGPIDDIRPSGEIEEAPLEAVPRQSEYGIVAKPSGPAVKETKTKPPKNVAVPVEEEPEKKEIRLIAYVKSEQEHDPLVESVKEKKPKKEVSSSRFGFFSRSSKTPAGYPTTSDAYSGDLDTTDRVYDMEQSSFDHPEYPAYAPKVTVTETPEVPAEPEKKRYRLIARWRHEGDEDVVEKPDKYGFSTEVHDGPLDDIRPSGEIEHCPLEAVPGQWESWKVEKPASPLVEKKAKSPKKAKTEVPEEQEIKEVRLIARIKSEPEHESVVAPIKEKKPKKESSSKFGFFSRSAKKTQADQPTTSEPETFEAPAGTENKLYRLIARWRHEGDEDVVEKPDAYKMSSEVYSGELENIGPSGEIDQSPLDALPGQWEYSKLPVAPIATLEKKTKSPKREKTLVVEEPEKKEIRLIAYVKSEQEHDPLVESVKEKKPKKEGSSKFGFFSKTTKTKKTPAGYPTTSDAYTGELDTTDRNPEMGGSSFEHPEYPAYAPKVTVTEIPEAPAEPEKKHFRLFARWRHEGDEDVVEKPDAYAFAPEVYDGPLDDIRPSGEILHGPLEAAPSQWEYSRLPTPAATPEKKAKSPKKQKSPKKEKTPEPEEPESREVRLIARIKSEQEVEPVAEAIKEKKQKKRGSKSKISTFGFFHRTQEPSTSHFPTSEVYTGELDTTGLHRDIDRTPFDHPEYPAYAPKTNVEETPEAPVTSENRLYRLIARWRHEGDEDVVEKPDAYNISSGVYSGELENIGPSGEIDQSPLEALPGQWEYSKLPTSAATLEKKQKKAKSPKKEKIPTPEEPETREIRLVARVKSEQDVEPILESPVKEKSPSKFGFFSKITTKTSKTTGYPEQTEHFSGDLDTTNRSHEFEGTSFEHSEHPVYSPKKTVETPEVPHETENRLYRLIARWRHEGDEDVVEKPDAYAFAPDVYDGPLEDIRPTGEIEHGPLEALPGQWEYSKLPVTPVATLEKKHKKVKSPKKEKIPEPEEAETKEVQLIARIRSETEEEPTAEPAKGKEPKKESSSKFGFFSKSAKKTPAGYPAPSDAYTGEIDTTDRNPEMEGTSFDHPEYPPYDPKVKETPASPKSQRSETPDRILVEKKTYRLIARYRHDGEEDEVEKPEFYEFSPEMYTGELQETSLNAEIDHAALDVVPSKTQYSKLPESPVLQKKAKSPKKTKVEVPEVPGTREVRLIARIKSESEDDPLVESAKEKKPKKESARFGFFSRSNKTPAGYPTTSDAYTGHLDTTDRNPEMEGSSFDHPEYPAYAPKITVTETPEVPAEPEKKRYRLIARWKHEGDEDVVEKPDAYAFAPEVYDGPLDDIRPSGEIEHGPLDAAPTKTQYSKLPESPLVQKKIKSPKKIKMEEPAQPEKKEIRLIAKVRSEPEDEPVVKSVKEEKPKKESTRFGFFSRSSKTPAGYPTTSDAYSGDLDTTDRVYDMEQSSFDHPEYPAYVPKVTVTETPEVPAEPEKKRYRLIARCRHEGDEDVVEKPVNYGFSTEVHEGPLEDIRPSGEIEHSPLEAVPGQWESWKVEKPASPVVEEKTKSPKKAKAEIPEEPEKKEIRLIARIKTEPEDKPATEPVKEKKPKKDSSSRFGFFSRSKTAKTPLGYPTTSDAYTGHLDTTDRNPEMEGSSFDHPEYPAYAPKITVTETPEVSAEPEKKHFRLFARWRHEGDEEVVEKPDAYAFAPEVYDGPLDDIHPSEEIEHGPLDAVPGQWQYSKLSTPAATLEKKIKYPKKIKVESPEELETREVRLIARIRSEEDDEPVAEPIKEKKKRDSKSKLPAFGFFSKTTKTTGTGYPETSETFVGHLDTTKRVEDIEFSYFESPEHPEYSPKVVVVETPEVPQESENRLYRLIARWRHEGEEDVVEKPDKYGFSTEVHDGPLNDIRPSGEIDHAQLEASPSQWEYSKLPTPAATLEKKHKKAKSPKKAKIPEPEEPETREVRLIARIRSETEEDLAPEVDKEAKKRDSKSKLPGFGFFHRTSSTSHTEASELYTGNLESTGRALELETSAFEHPEIPAYSPKKVVKEESESPQRSENRLYRLIARWRHEGDEDVVEKPDAYKMSSEVYSGELENIGPSGEIDQSPLEALPGQWEYSKLPVTPVATLEKKTKSLKKQKSPKKEKTPEPEEPESREVRLIARIKSQQEVEPVVEPVKEKKPKKESSSKFGFFSRSAKKTPAGYPTTSDAFSGDLDTTDRSQDLESSPFEHKDIPPYVPKSTDEQSGLPQFLEEKKRYRLIARFRHEGEEDVVEKPDAYGMSSELYSGPLDDIHRVVELDQVPIGDYSTVTHHGESWRVEKLTTPVAALGEPEEPEKKEIRLIARIKTQPEEEPVKEKKPKKESSSKFGFFSKTAKKTPAGYPTTSDVFTGDLDTTDRNPEMEGSSFDHPEYPPYVPKPNEEVPKLLASTEDPSETEKKHFRLFARWRHDGDEDEVEKPDKYGFSSELFEGMLDDIRPSGEIEHAPLEAVPGQWEYRTIPASPVPSPVKKVKSPKKEKTPVVEEQEKKEIRLIAYVKSEPENEPSAEPVKGKKPKKDFSSRFGFFSRSAKKTPTGYPTTSDAFTGDLDTTERARDMESSSFDHPEYPVYAPKITEIETSEVPAEPEKKRYRLIARWRHEGDEDVVEKPDKYGFSTEVHEGPLDDIRPSGEIEHSPLEAVPGQWESWKVKKSASPVVEKKTKSPNEVKVETPEEPEKREVRLIARIKSEPEHESVVAPIKEKKPKKESSSKFGFFSKTTNTKKTLVDYPESDVFTGVLDKTERSQDLEGSSFDHPEYPAYAPKVTVTETPEIPAEPEKKRYRLIARFRHEGDEDVVEKPNPYAFADSAYDGPLEEISRENEIEQTPIADHANVYAYVEKDARPALPIVKTKKKSPKKIKMEEPEEPEIREVRLIARIKTELEDEPVVESVKEKKPKKESARFGFFSRSSKTPADQPTTPELETSEASAETENRLYRLIARWRHEGDEDVVEKPDAYKMSSEVYSGELENIGPSGEIDQSPLDALPGQWEYSKLPVAPIATLEKKTKSPKREKTLVVEEPEKKEIRLIAYVKSEQEHDPLVESDKEKKPKKEGSSKFGFFSKTTKTKKTPAGYPTTSDAYTGHLDTTDRNPEMEGSSFDHPEYPAYAPKITVTETPEVPAEPEKKRYRLIARWKHEGDEDVVEKPDAYAFAPEFYDGPLDDIRPSGEIEHGPLDAAPTKTQYSKLPESPLVQKKIKSPKKIKMEEPAEPEKKEIRLIAKVRSEPEDEPVVKSVKEEKPKKESTRFGFFSRSSKTPAGYPTTSDAYSGDLDTTDRVYDMEQSSFDHPEYPAYVPKVTVTETPEVPAEPDKKRYRLIARWRHEGDEDVVETPDKYGFSTEVHDGPLDDISPSGEIENCPLEAVPGQWESWKVEKPASPLVEKKTKSQKTVKVEEPEEPETTEVRLIARIKSKPEDESVGASIKKKPKKESSSKFGFFSKTTKTKKTPAGYPTASDVFTGELDTTLQYPPYVPKPNVEVPELLASTEDPSETEKKHFRLFARWRHDGDEDEVEKPDKYGFSSELFEGMLDDIRPYGEIEHAPLEAVPGQWECSKLPVSPVATLKHKKAKSPKKELIEEDPEKKEIRLIAYVRSEEPKEESVEEELKEKKPSKFGFFTRSPRSSKSTDQPSEPTYEGPLDETIRSDEFQSSPFEHQEFVTSTPDAAHEEKKPFRFNWFARWRHEGVEDVVEKPDPYGLSHHVYEGSLDDIRPSGEIQHAPLSDYSEFQGTGESWNWFVKKAKKEKRASQPTTPEPSDVKLVARIQPLEHEESPEKASPTKDRSRAASFNIFHRHSKTQGYPETTPVYEGDLDVFERTEDVEKSSFEMRADYPEYSPKKSIPEFPDEPPQQSRLHRLIARWRHEGEEDEVERPEGYGLSSEVYDGPLDEMRPSFGEMEDVPLSQYSEFQGTGESWNVVAKKSPKASKRQKEVTPEHEESTPFRLRFLSLAKKTPSEYPATSPTYEGPLDLTSRSDEMEPMPYLHGTVPRYSPKVTPVRKIQKIVEEEPKKYRLIARLRHEGEEDVVEKPDAYKMSSEVFSGTLNEMSKKQELDTVPIKDFSDVKHSGESWTLKGVRQVARVPPQAPEPFRFRFFSKGKSSGYPATSPTYEGPMDVTGRAQPLEHVPLEAREIPKYSPKKQEDSRTEEEPKRYRLIARLRHNGDEDVVEKPDAYGMSSEVYSGELEKTHKKEELTEIPLNQKSSDGSEDLENVPPRSSRFSFLRPTPKTRTTSYPSTSYSGPLDTTDLNLDLEEMPLDVPFLSPTPIIRKYRVIHRKKHSGEQDEVEPRDLNRVFYSFPVARYNGPLEMTSPAEEVPEVSILRYARKYHNGSSSTYLWHLLNRRSKEIEEKQPKQQKIVEEKKDIKLIARVLPMQKTPEEEVMELTKEEQAVHEALAERAVEPVDYTASTLNAINYIPSSLTYNVPRPARIEGHTVSGDCYVEIRHERRAEVQLEPAYVLREATRRSHAYLSTATAVFSGHSEPSASASATTTSHHSVVVPSFVGSVSEDETGLHHFSWTPPTRMSPQPPERMSFLARLGFKRDKSKKKDKKKSNGANKKGENETSGETSDSEHDEKREFAVVEYEPHAPPTSHQQETAPPPKKPEHRTHKSPGRRLDEPMNEVTVVVTSSEQPKELKNTKEVRHETREQQFRLTGDGYTSGFNPNDPSLMATIQRAERLNASSPRLEHAERTFTVRANAPLPVSFEESGQPYTTVSTWQETSDLPEQVEVYTDENGRQITRTVKSSQVKHTVQTQSFQNYIVDGDQVPVGVVDVERSREQLTPLGQKPSGDEAGGDSTGIVETQTRTMTYEAQGGENAAPPGWAEQGLGEYVSSKSVTQGNRTIETITYKTEKDGVVETHVEHRVTIHSDGDIDHDAELSQAIMEATQMNPDMVVEKIEVRQETTQ
ncbi:hypothetical protein L3Y34_016733 [Caenorhabditis briggsae]|uniref:Moesin/ezrin/radixin homolog 1 n=1 Tax=Caenorhabditis briggsae TaxID=6238 RepID=A0AAE9J149_CAEBR|nr:hypothetical protein L3Y34_016733 [Caenorhabditis briggsae]